MAATLLNCLSCSSSVPKLALDTFGLHYASLHHHAHEAAQLRFLQWLLCVSCMFPTSQQVC